MSPGSDGPLDTHDPASPLVETVAEIDRIRHERDFWRRSCERLRRECNELRTTIDTAIRELKKHS